MATILSAASPKTRPGEQSLGDPQRGAAPVILAEDLFGCRREVFLRHAGCIYRLRITQNNKLILTK